LLKRQTKSFYKYPGDESEEESESEYVYDTSENEEDLMYDKIAEIMLDKYFYDIEKEKEKEEEFLGLNDEIIIYPTENKN